MTSSSISSSEFLLENEDEGEEEEAPVLGTAGGTAENNNNNSTSLNDTYFIEEPYNGPEWYVIPVVFGVIFLVGVVGNGTLIYTVLRNKNMRSTPNVLLVSLALGDLLLILISVPFSSTIYTFVSWPYGQSICKLNEFLGSLSLGVSVFTLTALSGERYMVIVHPMASHRGPSTARTALVAAAIWVVSVGLATLDFVGATVQDRNGSGGWVCVVCPDEWGPWYEKFHSLFQFVVYFALPICVITTFYALMARMLLISSRQLPGDGIKGQAAKQIEARKKVARLVLSFVVVFAVCWLPRHVYFFWFYFDPSPYNMFWHVFKVMGFCLGFINSCINPLALYFLSRQFRRYYNRYMFCCCSCGGGGGAGGAGGGSDGSRRMRDDLNLGGRGGGGAGGGGGGPGTNMSMVMNPGGIGSSPRGCVGGSKASETATTRASTMRQPLHCVISGDGAGGGGGGRGGGGGGACGGRRKRSVCVTVLTTTTQSVC